MIFSPSVEEIQTKVKSGNLTSHIPLPEIPKVLERLRKPKSTPNKTEPHHERMKSGRFLICYSIANAVLLSSCATYIYWTRKLSVTLDNALVIPIILTLVPGKPQGGKKYFMNES